jgi:hypothetical protein
LYSGFFFRPRKDVVDDEREGDGDGGASGMGTPRPDMIDTVDALCAFLLLLVMALERGEGTVSSSSGTGA